MILAIRDFIVSLAQAMVSATGPFEAAILLFINGGWVVAFIIFYPSFKKAWVDWRQEVYHIKNRKFILLAIDIPKDNEQSPKAVENIFTHLHGALPGRNNKYEDWWLGKTPDYFSFEIVSIEGYVQFLVYTQEEYRDMVESAFYAHYPDAEITQVEDYVDGPNGEFKDLKFPDDKYNLLGTEFVLQKHFAYPIRLFQDFEHSLSQEYKDPMAAILENMNKIGPNEHMWIQIVATPEYDEDWQPYALAKAMAIAGKKVDVPSGKIDSFFSKTLSGLDNAAAGILPFYPKTEEKSETDLPASLMLHLTPAEQAQVEGIQLKADKVGFWCKMRFIYISPKETFSKARSLAPIGGAIKQFSSFNKNGLRTHKYTKTWGLDYLYVDERENRRKNNILPAYKSRARSAGSGGMILNVEELANLYHFPTIYVKAPLVSRTDAKRGSPPPSLPLDNGYSNLKEVSGISKKSSPPAELPVSENQPAGDNQGESGSAEEKLPDNLPFV